MSLTASYVILFVILVRLVLKKAPKVISYALWGVVAFRLLCPFSFEGMFSLLPVSVTPIPYDIAYQQNPQINSSIIAVDAYINRALPYPSVEASVNPLQIYTFLGAYIWVLGIAVMIVYSVTSVLTLKCRLRSVRHIKRNVYETNNLKTPFVLGIFRPRIYIPAGLTAEEKSHIILHENTHIRRYDHIIKPFAFFVLSIHWFNPLVWIAFILMSSDMEFSCDEKVINKMGAEIKKAYSASLLSLAMGKRILNGSPLAYGEGNVRGRIKNVLNYRKPSFRITILAVIAVVVVSIGLLANPKNAEEAPSINKTHINASINRGDLDSCVADAVKTFNTNQYHNADFAAEAHTILKTIKNGSTTKVYAMALYMEFGFAGSGFFETGGSHMPVEITFEKRATGEYELKEYWTPQEGSHYAPSIKGKFPSDIYEDALDTQKYVVGHIQSCYEQAIEYGSVPITGHLAKLVESICSSPTEASNPRAYIDAHPIEYREMIYYGKHTLLYCYTLFEQGGQTGLAGHIMASACRDILGEEDIDLLANTGQDWYDAFKESVLNLHRQNSDEYMKKNMPGSWLLLQMRS
jgi:beta-lactamase regulating signal transducer with metallopeptidase domain